jgi:hypothetical protein
MVPIEPRIRSGWSPATVARSSSGSASFLTAPTSAEAAGRSPSDVRRVYNLNGTISDGPVTGLLQGPPEHWVETLSGFARDLGFDTFIVWPGEDHLAQVERFARQVVPALRR